ncbi:trypsin-like peptidase domain-containing protein [Dactylosporangium sp. CS-033363]|uniref:VMAP-C domain-containing protein n=1 Tax=Dactylosporangium sp. CS-033363 TaxID=3239935 RepID=UPI003D946E45
MSRSDESIGRGGSTTLTSGAVQQLIRLVEQCMVLVTGGGRDGRSIGSGVLVAPRTVLTCAHVGFATAAQDITVTWQGYEYTAEVVAAGRPAPGGLWPYPDVAVLKVHDLERHPCAALGEYEPRLGAPLHAVGHSQIYEREPRLTTAIGTYGGHQEFQGEMLWRFIGDELAAGMSGGPVLDVETGLVCGITKTSRAREGARGGLLLPVQAVKELDGGAAVSLWRKHDVFHADMPQWPNLRQELETEPLGRTLGVLTAREHADLLALVADTPAPDLIELHEWCTGRRGLRFDERCTLLRDLVSGLADLMQTPGQLHPIIVLAGVLARQPGVHPADAAILEQWSVRIASRMGEWDELQEWRREAQRDMARSGPVGVSLISQIAPSRLEPGRYLLTVWLRRDPGEVQVIHSDEGAGADFDAVREVLQGVLRQQLAISSGPVTLEFVTPPELFDEPFDEWRLWPRRQWAKLGSRHPVVLRDFDRLDDPMERELWRLRWRQLRDDTSVTWIDCGDRRSYTAWEGWFQQHRDITVLGLPEITTGSPAQEALDVALFAGVPVVLWRRGPCEHGDAECPSRRLRGSFELHRRDDQSALPEFVRVLRSQTMQDDAHACQGLVLLWDDPDSAPAPDPVLTQPRKV